MTSQASSHDFNRSSGNKTSEDEEAKDLKIKRLVHKTALQGGKCRGGRSKANSDCVSHEPDRGLHPFTCSGGACRLTAVALHMWYL